MVKSATRQSDGRGNSSQSGSAAKIPDPSICHSPRGAFHPISSRRYDNSSRGSAISAWTISRSEANSAFTIVPVLIATENPLVMVTAVSQSLKNESKATAVPRLPGDRFGVSPGREASAVSQCGLGGFPHEQLANHERVLGSPQVKKPVRSWGLPK